MNERLQRGQDKGTTAAPLAAHRIRGREQEEEPSKLRLRFEEILDNSKNSGKGKF